ncbi:MAG: thiamine pyrophosphate-dependent enzyme [Pirellulaceae bacterium]
MTTQLPVLTPAHYASNQDVRWCPGCGDYSILAQMKKMMASAGVPPEKVVFISGIGCSSRFPYYMNTYGMHSIHGRAPAIATGLKAVRPDLQVWVITGDGDGLSIGGNHLIHAIRRNIDFNIVLFNNRIYGLTKGQCSPTSPLGKVTRSTPMGALDNPIHPLSVAIGCEATFVARTIDVNIKHLGHILKRAEEHDGTAFVEVYQNCVVFNDGAFDYATNRASKADQIIELEHGKPLIFGKNRDKGIRLNGLEPEVVELGQGIAEDDLLFHDERSTEPSLAYLLSRMRHEDGFPEPIGVFRAIEAPRYDVELNRQIEEAREKRGMGDLNQLFRSGETWTVQPDDPIGVSESADADDAEADLDDEEDLPVPATEVERSLLADQIRVLEPKDPLAVPPDTPIRDVLKMLVENEIGCVLVVENGKPVGIFSERDALIKINHRASELGDRPVAEFMTANPESLEINSKVAFAVQRMDLGGYRHVPIVNEEHDLTGVISVRDILHYLTEKMAVAESASDG